MHPRRVSAGVAEGDAPDLARGVSRFCRPLTGAPREGQAIQGLTPLATICVSLSRHGALTRARRVHEERSERAASITL